MNRITKKDLQQRFLVFCKTIGMDLSLSLDYIGIYGGYVIEKDCENGGVSHPFGSKRRNAKEMYDVLGVAIDTVWVVENNRIK